MRYVDEISFPHVAPLYNKISLFSSNRILFQQTYTHSESIHHNCTNIQLSERERERVVDERFSLRRQDQRICKEAPAIVCEVRQSKESMEKRGSNEEPLLLKREEEEEDDEVKQLPFTASSFIAEGDIDRIRGLGDFTRAFLVESKKLWFLAGPAIFTSICQYSLGAITQTFAGHVGTLQLAAVSIENSVIAGFSFGVMVSSQPSVPYH